MYHIKTIYMGAGHLSLYLDHALKGAGRIAGQEIEISLTRHKSQYTMSILNSNPSYLAVMLNGI